MLRQLYIIKFQENLLCSSFVSCTWWLRCYRAHVCFCGFVCACRVLCTVYPGTQCAILAVLLTPPSGFKINHSTRVYMVSKYGYCDFLATVCIPLQNLLNIYFSPTMSANHSLRTCTLAEWQEPGGGDHNSKTIMLHFINRICTWTDPFEEAVTTWIGLLGNNLIHHKYPTSYSFIHLFIY